MTPEAQRIAIAEACPTLVAKHEHGPGYVWNRGPLRPFGPLTDLNAMHEAEKVLTVERAEEYADWLVFITNANMAHSAGYLRYIMATAPAAQRAEAFLRTLGKWEDAK